MLLIAAGSLWLFLAAVPVFADGGPHVAASNSGVSTLTSDSCAGCHRAHTAQGKYLINQVSEEALCLSCHGTATAGATTSVLDGVQYVSGAQHGISGTILGALRGGGFENARIGDPGRLGVTKSGSASYVTKVTVAASGSPVNSAHIDMNGTLGNVHIAWGNGANNSGVGPSVTLSCVDCHNPHGNGQYRILKPVPAPVDVTNPVPVDIELIDQVNDVIYTKVGHPFKQGDLVTVAGVTGLNGDYVVWNSANGITLQLQTIANGIAAAAGMDITGITFTSGTLTRTSAPVADSPMGIPDANGVYPLKNYTVIQTKVTQAASYSGPAWGGGTFFASQVNGTYTNDKGDYWHRQVPWNAASGSTQDGPNGRPATVTATNQVAFNQQYTAWCSGCHTRYFANQNANPGGLQGSSTFYDRVIGTFTGTTLTISNTNLNPDPLAVALTSSGFSLGDVVTLASSNPAVTNGFVVWVAPVATGDTTFNIQVSDTKGGAPVTFTAASGNITRVAPATASQWLYPRKTSAGNTDSIFTYQHSTQSNRTCNVCHVAHGSNAVMDGAFSSTYTRPDQRDTYGSLGSSDSRLLKIDNRGTCQGCHDPTETWAKANQGVYIGAAGGNVVP
jgi:predicted CXXCH cytochrome family protein